MERELEKIKQKVEQEISAARNPKEIETLKIRYLGRKSIINQMFLKMSRLGSEEKKRVGKSLNLLKEYIAKRLEEKTVLSQAEEEELDLTLPSAKIEKGTKHVLSYVNETICDIFEKLGFEVIEGGEIEDEWHNFSALNIPLDHPSRDAFDTFYLEIPPGGGGKYLLRSHTSPSQIRVMKKQFPPLAVISPGRVYRPDKVDASHSFMFHQVEGFCVDTHITFAHLKGVLLHFARSFFSPEVKVRFRPHFFPFTEPSAEMDIGCMICNQEGCSVCSQRGWLEILGCGMIHPVVFEQCNIDSKIYKGFAFGMGVERIAMLKHRINDIRLFYENDLRFLKQFSQA